MTDGSLSNMGEPPAQNIAQTGGAVATGKFSARFPLVSGNVRQRTEKYPGSERLASLRGGAAGGAGFSEKKIMFYKTYR